MVPQLGSGRKGLQIIVLLALAFQVYDSPSLPLKKITADIQYYTGFRCTPQ